MAAGVSLDELDERRERRDALLWNYTVLGEAAGQISGETKARFPAVAWQQPVRLRNRIVHGYWSIDLEILLATAQHRLPKLVSDLRKVPETTSADG